jgi:hypothetical protein
MRRKTFGKSLLREKSQAYERGLLGRVDSPLPLAVRSGSGRITGGTRAQGIAACRASCAGQRVQTGRNRPSNRPSRHPTAWPPPAQRTQRSASGPRDAGYCELGLVGRGDLVANASADVGLDVECRDAGASIPEHSSLEIIRQGT